jgi:hypothetical protein
MWRLRQNGRMGPAMRKEDLKEMANRCRLMAGTADEFTKRRLLDLASKYEAQLESRSLPYKKAYSDRRRGEENPA